MLVDNLQPKFERYEQQTLFSALDMDIACFIFNDTLRSGDLRFVTLLLSVSVSS